MIFWLGVVLLLGCSGIVSASETALFGLSRRVLYEFGQSGRALRRRARVLMQQPRRVLMTVLLANTAINVAIFAVSFVGMHDLRRTHPAAAAAGSVTVLVAVILFGEIVPKTIAISNPRRFAPAAAGLLAVLQVVLAPIRWFLRALLVDPLIRLLAPSVRLPSAVTTEELKLLVEHSAHEGTIDSEEHEMFQAIVTAGHVSVREVMTPRVDIRSVRIGSSRKAVLEALRIGGRRKILVHGRDVDDIRGVLYARNVVLNPHASIKSLIKPIHFVPEQVNLVQLLRQFRATDAQFAVVVDEYGGTAGFVSIEDVVEWIVGDVPDEDEVEATPEAEMIDENTYRVPGNLNARLWAERFAVRRIARHADTVGGLVVAQLGRMPRVGDSIRIRNLVLTVERVHKRRIERILLRREGDGVAPEERAK